MPDRSAVSAARTALYDAVTTALAGSPWRVHRVVPASITAPTIYLDSVELGPASIEGASFTAATFPVVIVADGLERRQVEQLDDLVALVWDAARDAGGEPDISRPLELDVGGPTLRAQIIRVDMTLTVNTLCRPVLAPAMAGGGIP